MSMIVKKDKKTSSIYLIPQKKMLTYAHATYVNVFVSSVCALWSDLDLNLMCVF